MSGSLDSETRGRSLDSAHAAIGILEHPQDFLALAGVTFVGHRSGLGAIASQSTGRHLKSGALGQDHRTLNEIFQFSDVDRPTPPRKLFHGASRNKLNLLLHATPILIRKVT